MASSPNARGPIAPEYTKLLLKAMSTDGEYLTKEDLLRFVRRKELPFPEELLLSMFEEANSTGNGLVDAEQLGKSVSHKFAFRRHTADWERLFEAALPMERLRSLSPRMLEQEPILANFEQEPNILTFWPVTNAGVAAEGSPAAAAAQPGRPLRDAAAHRQRRLVQTPVRRAALGGVQQPAAAVAADARAPPRRSATSRQDQPPARPQLST